MCHSLSLLSLFLDLSHAASSRKHRGFATIFNFLGFISGDKAETNLKLREKRVIKKEAPAGKTSVLEHGEGTAHIPRFAPHSGGM